MRKLALTAILAGMFGLTGGAQAQLSQSFHSACPGKPASASWCPDQISKEGWTLKYKTESSQDLMDVYYRYEVWIREKLAVVCVELRSGRGGGRANACQELSEAHQ
jgi:hypothetical protein